MTFCTSSLGPAPPGATTNSDSGVTDLGKPLAALQAMAEVGMPLLVHGEVRRWGGCMQGRGRAVHAGAFFQAMWCAYVFGGEPPAGAQLKVLFGKAAPHWPRGLDEARCLLG